MITLKFPLSRGPTPEEWRRVWGLTRIPPNTRAPKGQWRIKVNEGQYAELLAYLQALALDLGFIYAPLPPSGRENKSLLSFDPYYIISSDAA